MVSLISVQCPHCGAQGQILLPPVGSIIIGPCPECKELVAVFCGQVLPLDKHIMENADVDEKRSHLLEVLTDFLEDRVGKLMTDDGAIPEDYEEYDGPEPDSEEPELPASKQVAKEISQGEVDQFLDVDLKLLDNQAYFKSVFNGQ